MRKMNFMKLACGMLAAVALTTPIARATPSIQIILAGTNPTDNLGNQAVGFSAYIVRLQTDNASKITSVDAGGTSNPDTGITNGFFGPMLQRKDNFGSPAFTPAEPDEYTPAASYSTDSHFVVPTAIRIDVNPGLSEDNDINNPPPGAPANVVIVPNTFFYSFGTGSKLQGTFGIDGASQSSSFDLAYIVVPNGKKVTYSLDVSESDNTSQAFHLSGTVPEPALSPMLLSGLGLMLRRRRISSGK